MPAAVAARLIVAVLVPFEHVFSADDPVITKSQSTVLFVTFAVEKDPEEGFESPYLYWKYTVTPSFTAVVV